MWWVFRTWEICVEMGVGAHDLRETEEGETLARRILLWLLEALWQLLGESEQRQIGSRMVQVVLSMVNEVIVML
jgi:hypothetical protein